MINFCCHHLFTGLVLECVSWAYGWPEDSDSRHPPSQKQYTLLEVTTGRTMCVHVNSFHDPTLRGIFRTSNSTNAEIKVMAKLCVHGLEE